MYYHWQHIVLLGVVRYCVSHIVERSSQSLLAEQSGYCLIPGMGGVLGQLVCLLCRSGCSASTVASALAFHPPDPLYEITKDINNGKYIITLCPELPMCKFRNVDIHMIQTKSGSEIPVVIFPTEGAKYTVLYSHGNATDIGAMYAWYAHMALSLGVTVVGYDYTGYGPFAGQATEKQVYLDISAVYEFLCHGHVRNPGKSLILYGQSVGSGPSCFLAQRQPVVGLILHSPIMSGVRVLTASRLLACCDIFPNIDRIKRVHCPVLIIHGENDQEVGVHHGRLLHDAVPDEHKRVPWWVPERGHNDILIGNEHEYYKRLASFISEIHELGDDSVKNLTIAPDEEPYMPGGVRGTLLRPGCEKPCED